LSEWLSWNTAFCNTLPLGVMAKGIVLEGLEYNHLDTP